MAVKHNNLYLYLTLACFLGIILIFIFDGYMGVYDTIVMDNGQYQQRVEADKWQTEKYGYLAMMIVERGGRIDFNYTVENHKYSAYSTDIKVSLYYGQEKLADLLTGTITAGAFNKGDTKWSLNASNIVPQDYPAEQSYNLNIIIRRGEIERKINININPSPYPAKAIPAPPR